MTLFYDVTMRLHDETLRNGTLILDNFFLNVLISHRFHELTEVLSPEKSPKVYQKIVGKVKVALTVLTIARENKHDVEP